MSEKHFDLLEKLYGLVLIDLQNKHTAKPPISLSKQVLEMLHDIADNSEYFLGVLNVVITSLTEKAVNPCQDIRKHQAKMDGGYSGRTLDTKVIVPWLKSKGLKSMRESGWLTRSLEQDSPYNLDYKGAIRNPKVKSSFLGLLDSIENHGVSPEDCLYYLLQLLEIQKEQGKIEINPLQNKAQYTINEILSLLESHFEKSQQAGTARLPVIAMYSMYQIIVKELSRYKGKILLPLESHTAADFRSGSIGDIQINDSAGMPFEGIEIKYQKLIDSVSVMDAFEKFKPYQVERYYLLSTKTAVGDESNLIGEAIEKIKQQHGCQVIVNGLMSSLKYYLRLINETDQFITNYAENITKDLALKYDHKIIWKGLVENIK